VTLAGRCFGPAVEARLRLAAERLLRHRFEAWFYGDSIGFEGLLEASELFGVERYRSFAHGFLRGWAARDLPRRADDNTAPGRVLCELADEEDDAELSAAAHRLAGHLAARRRVGGTAVTFEDARRSLREPYGGGALPADEARLLKDPGPGIYVDCLHFDPPFYAALGLLEEHDVRESGARDGVEARGAGEGADPGGGDWGRRAVEEAVGYAQLLQDPATGRFAHFWLERTGRTYGLGWGRGQGWALLGLLDVLDLVPATTVGRTEVERSARRLLEAMLLTQRPDGSWHAVIGEPDSGDETSTGAFMAAAFVRAARLGLAERSMLLPAAERAWAAVLEALDEDGLLSGVSAAVYASTQPGHYHHVPRGSDVPWGQGALLVAALERARGEETPLP